MSSREDETAQGPKVERAWNHARFTIATRLPTAVARAKHLQHATLQTIRSAARLK